jgi:hypothetical protein
LDEDILIHQLVDLIQDTRNATSAGWQLDNCQIALNTAIPLDPTNDTVTNLRALVDLMQNAGSGTSFMKAARGVEMGHLWAIEPQKIEGEGRISHWILDRLTGNALFARERRYPEMKNVVTAFTLEESNDYFYGPKGLGRILINISIAVDELVNDAVSQLKMNGLMIIKTDFKGALNAQIQVRSPFVIIKADGQPLDKEQFPFDIDAFMGVYGQLQKMAEIAAGAYIANVATTEDNTEAAGGRRTAREATIDYTRELQSKAAGISRFIGQYQGVMLREVQR